MVDYPAGLKVFMIPTQIKSHERLNKPLIRGWA